MVPYIVEDNLLFSRVDYVPGTNIETDVPRPGGLSGDARHLLAISPARCVVGPRTGRRLLFESLAVRQFRCLASMAQP